MKEGFDLLVKGGLVAGSHRIDKRDIAVKDGKIVKLARDLDPEQAEEVIDASGRYVLPGLLDVHVHPVYVDTIQDCSILGAFGGITTMIHYAYARPGMELARTAREFIEEGSETSYTDFAVHGAMFDPENQIKDIPKCFEMGVTSFKMFMTYAKLGWMTDDYHLAKAMDVISQHGGLAMVHAEDGLSIDYLEDKFRKESQREVFLRVRPGILEADAVFRAISIAQVMNCPLYIVHVSAREALEPIKEAREQGQRVYTETCPQYLCLTDRDLQEKGPLAKVGPPLRTTEDNDALWWALKTGLIDVIASDHAPKAKKIDDDFFEAPFGSPSSETMLAVIYQRGINEGRLDLCTLVRAMSESPAKIFGLYPRKGALERGSDADLLVLDPAASHRITQETQHSKAGYTLYDGMDCLGKPILVVQRGKILLDREELRGSKGQGSFLETKISAA